MGCGRRNYSGRINFMFSLMTKGQCRTEKGGIALLCREKESYGVMRKIIDSINERPLNGILIIFVVAMYLFNNIYLKFHSRGIMRDFFVCYLNDLICPLFFFSYSNLLLITVNREITKLRIICLISICTSFTWEYLAPLLKPSAVTDSLDIVCYVVGGVIYWFILYCVKRKNRLPES